MTITRSVLIIDDNKFDVLLTRKMLEKTGYFDTIYAATDGAEALALFRDHQAAIQQYEGAFPPLLILLDINMPLMNGFEFLEAYEALTADEERPTSVVVMLTSSSHSHDRERALTYPTVKGYVVKPMDRQRARELADQVDGEWSASA